MPTSWDTDGALEDIFSLLDMLIHNAERINAIRVLGGDFNTSIGAPEASDDLTLLGACENGVRNWRGTRMIHWISEQGLQILNRLDSPMVFFFSLAPFFRDWVSVSCFTGQLPGIGTVVILASLQMCKVQRQSPLASQGGWGGRRLESAGSGGSCARRSLRVGGSPSRL